MPDCSRNQIFSLRLGHSKAEMKSKIQNLPLNLGHNLGLGLDQSASPFSPTNRKIISAVSCPMPDHPRHGRVTFNTLTYNSLISYECNYGYMIIGTLSPLVSMTKYFISTIVLPREIDNYLAIFEGSQ